MLKETDKIIFLEAPFIKPKDLTLETTDVISVEPNIQNDLVASIFIIALFLLFVFSSSSKPNKKLNKVERKLHSSSKSLHPRGNDISADAVKQKLDFALALIDTGDKRKARLTINKIKSLNLNTSQKKLLKKLQAKLK
jgi:regulatory protein YycI of two-component signal transduction system YycFG